MWLNVFLFSFLYSIILFDMAPKRKATISPKGVKPDKKGIKVKKENVLALTEDDHDKKVNQGKNEIEKRNEENNFFKLKRDISLPELIDKNNNMKAVNFPNLALNELLKQKSKITLQGSMRWKTFLFPPTINLKFLDISNLQYFGIDLVDEDKERTHWTHKPTVWENLFEGVKEMAEINLALAISPMFDGILSCPLRAVPNGPNEIKTFKTAKDKHFLHWILLVPMPSGVVSSQYIKTFLTSFKLYINNHI